MSTKAFNTYIKSEEIINSVSHGIGLILSIFASIILIIKTFNYESNAYFLSIIVYGFSLIFLYTSSTLYHSIQKPSIRNRLNKMDHMAIYLLIAGTYTPYTILVLPQPLGLIIFSTVWLSAILGITLKIFFFGKYNTISAIAYVVMGWIIVIAIKSLFINLGFSGSIWLFVGGIFYTLGALIYLIERLPYNHAIFHFFVLAGSISHFISIYYFVLK